MAAGIDPSVFLGLVAAGLHKVITVKDYTFEAHKDLIDNFPYPAALVFPSEHIGHCNQQLIDLLGYERWELKEKSFSEYTHADFKEKDLHLFQAVVDPRKSLDNYKMTKAWHHKDGHVVWGHLTVIPVMNEKHEVLYTIAWVKPTNDKSESHEIKTVVVEAKDNVVIQALKEFAKSASPIKLMFAVFGFMMGLALMWNFGRIFDLLETVFSSGVQP